MNSGRIIFFSLKSKIIWIIKKVVECDDDFWRRDEAVRFKHELTRKYLHITGDAYGRPISGQLEVCGYSYPTQNNLWHVDEGVYIKPSEPLVNAGVEESAHIEL